MNLPPGFDGVKGEDKVTRKPDSDLTKTERDILIEIKNYTALSAVINMLWVAFLIYVLFKAK